MEVTSEACKCHVKNRAAALHVFATNKRFCMSSRGNLKKEKRLRGLLGWGESTFAELSMRTTCWVFAKVRYPYLRLILDFSSNTWYIICEDQGF